jgi:pimeloyl-ACP methyl ester carboxylesterase
MGVPVVMLHGYTDSASSFDLLVERLPDWVEPYPLTHREHGEAGGVAAFMDAVGLEEAVILGHSAGSYTAQRFAVDHPERTLGVVLLGAFRSCHDHPGLRELWEAVTAMGDAIAPEFAAEFQHSTIQRPVPTAFLEMVIAESRALPAAEWRAGLQAMMRAPIPTRLGTITAPTLIVWGQRDAICSRADQHALVAAIPGAELVIYEGTGHAPHWELPVRVAADLAAFTLRAGSRPRSVVAR